MSSRRIILSSSHGAALRFAAEWLESRTRHSEALVIAPTRAAADEFARAACATGLLGVHRLTLTQIAVELAAQAVAERGLAPVSLFGLEALAARVVHMLRREGKLAYFERIADMPGFARKLASTLGELRLQKIPPPKLVSAGAPGVDLAQLSTLYEAELAERSLADLATLLDLATDAARDGKHRLLGLPLVLLHAPLDSDSHRRLADALAAKAPAVLATALASDEQAIRVLEQILEVKAEADRAPAPRTLDRLRARLFSIESLPAEAPDDSLEFFSAPGEGLECVEIARRIRLLAGEGIAFDRIAILLRSPERYQPLVEEALRRAGIPGYFSRGSARPDPAGRALLALLACAAEGCTATGFAEYLSLGQVPVAVSGVAWVPPEDEVLGPDGAAGAAAAEEPEDESPVRAPFGWERLLVDAAVVGGSERWARRLGGLEQEFRIQLAELAEEDSGRLHLERQLAQLKELERFALPLIDALAALPARAPWGQWLDRLADLARTALRQPDSVLAMLGELEPMGEVGPVSLDEVYGVLSERLRFLRREPLARRYGMVFTGTIEEARARSFDVVFLPGLAEGLFPRRASEDPLLLDAHRRKLPAELMLQDDRVARERLLLRTAAAAAATRLVVSYPRMDTAQARPRVPSFYMLEVVRAAEGRLPSLREFEKRAAGAAPARLGWPAPIETRQAVDDAEYDLASLALLLDLPPGEARGKGRYLVAVNEPLARSLRTRWRRWHKLWSGADGIVDPDAATRAVLAQHRLTARAYSASALQHFALCPYRFLLYALHQLRKREEAVALEKLDPLTRGSLFHAAQFRLFQELERAGALSLDEILDLADAVLDRVAGEYREKLAPAIPRVWATEVEDLRTDLRGWMRRLIETHAEWQPLYYEFSFGLPLEGEHDPRSAAEEAVVLDGVRLRGSIDVVEKHASRGVLRVTDHKTGKPPENRPGFVGGGVVLQPLLYALAAERFLEEPVESGRLFYCTERGNYEEVEIRLTDEARLRMGQVAGTIDRCIADGFLPAAPQQNACETCDYKLVCGPYEEQRVRMKPEDARLEALLELRRMP